MTTNIIGRRVCGAALAILAIAVSTAAMSGSDFPFWDMQLFSGDRAAPSGYAGCIEAQLEARNRVRSRWPAVSPAVRSECVKYVLNDDIPPSYYRLDACVGSLFMKGR